jgi:hypothetical protein
MKKNLPWEIIGWYGTVAIVGAYFLNSFSVLEAKSALYQVLNTTGAIGIVAVSYRKKAYQPMVLNVIWTLIGAIALISLVLK